VFIGYKRNWKKTVTVKRFSIFLVTAFRVVEKVSEKYFEEGFGVEVSPAKPDKSQIKAVKKPDKSQDRTPKMEDKILDIIKITPDISIPKLAIELDRTPDSIRYYLRQLVQNGRVRHEGSRKSGKWIVL